MAVCSNCGGQSDLTLLIKKKGAELWEYCPKEECQEETKNRIRSMRDQIACANQGSQEKGENND